MLQIIADTCTVFYNLWEIAYALFYKILVANYTGYL